LGNSWAALPRCRASTSQSAATYSLAISAMLCPPRPATPMKPRLSFSLGDHPCASLATDQTPTPAVARRNSRRVVFVIASLTCWRRFTFLAKR
jgi:hypothetical protein